jgi:hypothetical protein
MAFVLLTGIGDLLGLPKRLSVGIEHAINGVHVPAGVERFGVKRLKQRITLLMSFLARDFALKQPIVARAGVDGVWAEPPVTGPHARLRASPLP